MPWFQSRHLYAITPVSGMTKMFTLYFWWMKYGIIDIIILSVHSNRKTFFGEYWYNRIRLCEIEKTSYICTRMIDAIAGLCITDIFAVFHIIHRSTIFLIMCRLHIWGFIDKIGIFCFSTKKTTQ